MEWRRARRSPPGRDAWVLGEPHTASRRMARCRRGDVETPRAPRHGTERSEKRDFQGITTVCGDRHTPHVLNVVAQFPPRVHDGYRNRLSFVVYDPAAEPPPGDLRRAHVVGSRLRLLHVGRPPREPHAAPGSGIPIRPHSTRLRPLVPVAQGDEDRHDQRREEEGTHACDHRRAIA